MKLYPFSIFFLAGICLTPVLADTPSGEATLRIAVQSHVDRPFEGWGKADIKSHGKAYLLASISEGRSDQPLVMPVDEAALLGILREELTKRGFHEVKTESPEIILTVIYGRGYLKNPHFYDSPVQGEPPVPIFRAASRKYILKSQEYGFKDKVDRANLEKLFIRITAWANPADQIPETPNSRIKPKELWHTTMTVDDPGNRDLNKIMEKLLTTGSNFFDRAMDDAEEIITEEIPEGSVHYGETIILEDE